MGMVFRLAELLIVMLPVVGLIVAGYRAFSAHQRRAEEDADPIRAGEAEAPRAAGNHTAQWGSIKRVLDEHSRTDERWLEYELDVAALLDFPMMTDLTNPLTSGFHKAKLRADFLRPTKAEHLLDDRESAEQYFTAVEDYVTAFNVAEAEAKRRRRNDFSREGRQRIARAQSLMRVASDAGATGQERLHAYDLARKELDGLILLPQSTHLSIERGISGELSG